MSIQNTFRTLGAMLNSRFYPMVNPEIDIRYRLPRKDLHKLSVLNVGVGSGYSGLARQLPFIGFGSLTMIDVHQPYLDMAELKTWDAGVVKFIKADVRDFDVTGYDIVMMFDVLEHLPKEESIAIMKKITGKQVIFGPLEPSFRKNDFGVESQDHLSLWTEQDFIDLGYKTEILPSFHHEGDLFFDATWALK
jgi:ubiquinone/menaquinone biosynthesis C-methylase UbiE